MSDSNQKTTVIVAAVVAALLIGGVIGWMASRASKDSDQVVTPTSQPTVVLPTVPHSTTTTTTVGSKGTSTTDSPQTTVQTTTPPTSKPPAGGGTGGAVADRNGDGVIKYVALGDSFSSGTGAPPYDLLGGCARSSNAYPFLFAKSIEAIAPTEVESVACAGAKIRHITEPYGDKGPAQIAALDGSVDLVTLSIGGNDVGWTEAVIGCSILEDCEEFANQDGTDIMSDRIKSIEPALTDAYNAVKAAAPNATIVVFGYAEFAPLTEDAATECPAAAGWTRKEMDWVAREMAEINSVVKRAAAAAGVRYVEVGSADQGHELCTEDPYHNGYTLLPDPGSSFHPNAKGYQAMAAVLSAALIGV